MSDPQLRIGTRGSPLARAQADEVARLIAAAHGLGPDALEVVVIATAGDAIQDRPLSEVGGKGLFTKQIETALIEAAIDLAVHSAKDVATMLPEGLALAACLKREDRGDMLVTPGGTPLAELPEGARIGTSSLRRAAQMRHHRADFRIVPFRGNIGTRLDKLADGVADATVLAAAGLNRLGRHPPHAERLDPRTFLPAPGQGAIVIEIRGDDRRVAELVRPLADAAASVELTAERAFLAGLDGSCRTPIGALTEWPGGRLRLTGELLVPDGSGVFRAALEGPPDSALALGHELAALLRAEAGEDFFAMLEARP